MTTLQNAVAPPGMFRVLKAGLDFDLDLDGRPISEKKEARLVDRNDKGDDYLSSEDAVGRAQALNRGRVESNQDIHCVFDEQGTILYPQFA